MERRTIAACFVEEALDSLRRRGVATGPVLAAAGLPAEVREPVSAERYGALWLAIAAAIGDEFFGLGGRPMRPGSFTLLCHCVLHTATLEQALHRALRFLGVVLDDPRGTLVVTEGMAQIVLTDSGEPAFGVRLPDVLADRAWDHLLAGGAADPAAAGRFPLPGAGAWRRIRAAVRRPGAVRAAFEPAGVRCLLSAAAGGADRADAETVLARRSGEYPGAVPL